jgi:tryptophan-rich sensory protein
LRPYPCGPLPEKERREAVLRSDSAQRRDGDEPSKRRSYGWPEMIVAGMAINAVAQLLGPTTMAKDVYAGSTRPPISPPAWSFGIVWPINNLLTLWGNREVLNAEPSADRTAYLRLQAATWALFISYGFVRFRLRSPILGYVNTILYLALTVASSVRAARLDRKLLASYSTLLPWLVLASVLQIYQLNDPDPIFDT